MSDVKYCPECGAKNNADALFCEDCGVKFEAATAPEEPKEDTARKTIDRQTNIENEPPHEAVRYIVESPAPKKSHKVLIIIIVLIALAGAGVFAYFHFFQKTEVDLTKNLDADILNIEGYDGEAYIDNIDMDMARERWGYKDADENVQLFLETLKITTDKNNDVELSNGDTIKIIVKYKKADAEQYKIKVTGDEKTVKISGLPTYNRQESSSDYETGAPMEYYDEDDLIRAEVCEDYLDEDYVRSLDDEELQLRINYLFANHGFIFGKDDVREYFEATDWYDTTNGSDDEKVIEKRFSDIEKDNLKLMKKIREERKDQ